jgi:hypothetical protein
MGTLVGGEVDEAREPAATRILVALGNPRNAPALVDAALRMTGGRRPAELLLVRLIPTSRAPEFRTGLLEAETEVEAAVESMRPLVEQAAAAGVTARPIAFLSDEVGPDLARVAADQGCEAILLGWHRASLSRQVIQALVHRVFTLARCDVVVFVDREGQGIVADGAEERPVVVALAGGEHDAAARRIGANLARSLGASTKLVGYVGPQPGQRPTESSERLARLADELRAESGRWTVPVFVEGDARDTAAAESLEAAVTVVTVADDWARAADFGETAAALVEAMAGPTLVVRAAGVEAATPEREHAVA